MDNGRHNGIFSSPEVDDNLNEENWQRSLEISTPTSLPSPEQLSKSSDDSSEENPTTGGTTESTVLGQITPLQATPEQPEFTSKIPDTASIKTTGDYLDKASLAVIDKAIEELDQTGNLDNFYDEVRNMTEVNLNNSFNRKLYMGDENGGDN